jgi:hypothetical protein
VPVQGKALHQDGARRLPLRLERIVDRRWRRSGLGSNAATEPRNWFLQYRCGAGHIIEALLRLVHERPHNSGFITAGPSRAICRNGRAFGLGLSRVGRRQVESQRAATRPGRSGTLELLGVILDALYDITHRILWPSHDVLAITWATAEHRRRYADWPSALEGSTEYEEASAWLGLPSPRLDVQGEREIDY